MNVMKTCVKCKQQKAPAEFYPHPSTTDGLRKTCRKCWGLWTTQRKRDRRAGIPPYRGPRPSRPVVPLTEAQKTLVADNRKLIGYTRRLYYPDVPYEQATEFESVGVFGLIRAAQKYDPSRGVAFATYAVLWIRHFLSKSAKDRVAWRDFAPSREPPHVPDPSSDGPARDLETRDVLDMIARRVPPAFWRLLVWHYGMNLTHREIGQRIGLSRTSAEQKIRKALVWARGGVPDGTSV